MCSQEALQLPLYRHLYFFSLVLYWALVAILDFFGKGLFVVFMLWLSLLGDVPGLLLAEKPTGLKGTGHMGASDPVVQPIIEEAPAICKNPSIADASIEDFYAIFWQLSYEDIAIPERYYEGQIKAYSGVIARCRDRYYDFCRNNCVSEVAKAEKGACAGLERCQKELSERRTHVARTMEMVRFTQSQWLPTSEDPVSLVTSIVQHCLLRRSFVAESDVGFCFKFAMMMHRLDIPNFSLLAVFSKVLSENLPAALSSTGASKTRAHAGFICHIFAKMTAWYEDESLYIKEAHRDGLRGFRRSWNSDAFNREAAEEDLLSFTEFIQLMKDWHLRTCLAIEQALQSGKEHQIRNAYIVLEELISYFPVIREQDSILMKAILALVNHEHQNDVRILGRRCVPVCLYDS